MKMKIGLVQLDIEWELKKVNYKNAEACIKIAAKKGCDVVVLPEMFNTGFSMNIAAIAEDENAETSLILSRLSKEYKINLIAGYATTAAENNKGNNTAVVYNRSGELLTKYTKIHPFSFALEDQHYNAGTSTSIFQIDGMTSSVFICYDLRFPEVFRSVAKEVQAIFIIANWPAARKSHWLALLKARAIENQCFIIAVNRTGTDGNGINYSGDSCIYSPQGEEICSGDSTNKVLIGDVDPDKVREIRLEFPFLNDMRFVK
jgi:predicted amidohydrolase